MKNRVGERVVLLGGSMCGMLAAAVLADAFTEVLLIDRDRVTDIAGYRRGVPHGRHAHGLVARGQQIMEQQFPGLTNQLRAAGVTPGDFNSDIRWYFNGQRLRPARSGLLSVPATRPVLEHHVRLRVRDIPNVTFLEDYDITGLDTTPDGRRVTGARVRRREVGSQEEILSADLVIDTTGRGSRTPVWLRELGYQPPAESHIKIDLAYTTRHFRLRCDPFGSDLAFIPAPTPSHPRGAFFYKLPGGRDRIELSLTGMLGDHPPTDPDGFMAFVRSLPVPEIYEAVRDAEPIDDAVTFRFPMSVRRHYEKLTRFPERLLVMGDAVCSFNPLYAQGMTVTALESVALQRHLQSGAIPRSQAFFRDIGKVVDSPWQVSAGADLAYPGVEGPRTPKIRLVNSYIARLQDAAVDDPVLSNAFIRTAGLIDPPQALLRPGNVIRVLRRSGRTPAVAPNAVRQPDDAIIHS